MNMMTGTSPHQTDGMQQRLVGDMFGRHAEIKLLFDAFDTIVTKQQRQPRQQQQQQQHKERRRSSKVGKSAQSADSARPSTQPAGTTQTDASAGIDDGSNHPQRRSKTNRPIPAVFVSGVSGTGKSNLLEEFFDDLKIKLRVHPKQSQRREYTAAAKANEQHHEHHEHHDDQVYILRGKLDEYSGMNNPYVALVQAITSFVQQLEQGPTHMMEYFQHKLAAGLSIDDCKVLTKVIPPLAVLLPSHAAARRRDATQDHHEDIATNAGDTWKSVQYLFVQLIKIISSEADVEADVEADATADAAVTTTAATAVAAPSIILFLDDLQWASSATLTLLSRLLMDPSITNFMLIGTVREDEIDNRHHDDEDHIDIDDPTCFHEQDDPDQHAINLPPSNPFMQMVGTLEKLPRYDPTISHVKLRNMTLAEVTQWMSSLLDSPTKVIQTLSSKLHHKTLGNPFYIVQALEALQRENRISYDDILCTWRWEADGRGTRPSPGSDADANSSLGIDDDDRSLLTVSVGGNVEDLITSKMKYLPKTLQQLLTVASYIQSQFELSTLRAVWNEIKDLISMCDGDLACWGDEQISGSAPDGDQDLTFLLDKAVLEGLLTNTIGAASYRFAHDRIQQVARNVIPEGESRDKLRRAIGCSILNMYNRLSSSQDATAAAKPIVQNDDGLLFIAADHLNSVPNKDALFLVNLNLQVGEIALAKSALPLAASYLEKAYHGFQLVRNNQSEHFHGIFIRLSRARGSAEAALGNYDVATSIFNLVLKRAKTLEERLPCYLPMADILARQHQHDEAVEVLVGVAQELKIFPKRWFALHAAKNWRFMKNFIKGQNNEAILNLPLMTDSVKEMGMKILSKLTIQAFLIKNSSVGLVSMGQQLRLLKKYGLCGYSASPLMSCAVIALIMNDCSTANRLALLARKILDITQGKKITGRIHLTSSSCIFSWSRPHHEQFKDLETGYRSAMQVGDVDIAAMNWSSRNSLGIAVGQDLGSLVQSQRAIIDQTKQYHILSVQRMAEAQLPVMRNLAGDAPIDWVEVQNFGSQSMNNKVSNDAYFLTAGYSVRLRLAVCFQRYAIASELAGRFEKVHEERLSYSILVPRLLFVGLAAAGYYRSTKKKKHLRRLQRNTRELKSLVRHRGSNCLHQSLMLTAQLKAVTSRHTIAIKQSYDLAIAVASKAGCIHDVALASELAGETFLRMGEEEMIGTYFTDAVIHYNQWSCKAKVDDIKSRHLQYLDLKKLARSKGKQITAVHISTIGFNGRKQASDDTIGAETGIVTSMTPVIPGAASTGQVGDVSSKQDTYTHTDDDDISVLSDGSV